MKKHPFLYFILFSVLLISFCHQQAQTSDFKRKNGVNIENYSVQSQNDTIQNDTKDESFSTQENPSIIYGLEIPKTKPTDVIIKHTGYSLLYNEAHEQASWVAYELTKEETNKIVSRSDHFMVDPSVASGSATNNDYKNSGYDRGHLAPAADMGWSQKSMEESFYFSNMSPQDQSFNRGIWKKLEELVRTWAIENNSIYIATGPVLKNGLPTIGLNKVSVPKYFYKVILDYTEPGIKGIGFIIPNQASKAPLQNYAVSIDSVEKFTGINFFYQLPNEQENEIEKTRCIECWSWQSIKISAPTNTHQNTNGSIQCSGICKSGNRCKRMTKSLNGRCYQHGGN